MRNNFLLALIFSLVLVLSLLTSKTVAAKSLIGTIKNSSVIGGASCYFELPETRRNSHNYIFLSEIENNPAWINIDGVDTQLKLVSSTLNHNREKLGDKSSLKYKAGNIKINLNRIITSVCKPNDHSCELTGYDATITAIKSNRKQIIKVKGGCGS